MRETAVVLNPGSGGVSVRTEQMTIFDDAAPGVLATVQVQAVLLTDDVGNIVDLAGLLGRQVALLESIDARLADRQFRGGGL